MRSVALAAMALMAGPPAPTPPASSPSKPAAAAGAAEPKPCDKLKPLRTDNPNPAQRHLPGLF